MGGHNTPPMRQADGGFVCVCLIWHFSMHNLSLLYLPRFVPIGPLLLPVHLSSIVVARFKVVFSQTTWMLPDLNEVGPYYTVCCNFKSFQLSPDRWVKLSRWRSVCVCARRETHSLNATNAAGPAPLACGWSDVIILSCGQFRPPCCTDPHRFQPPRVQFPNVRILWAFITSSLGAHGEQLKASLFPSLRKNSRPKK